MADAEHTVEATLVALTQGDFVGVVEQFHDQFIFIDHAIELEFTDKAQLIDFLTLNRKLFPDSKRADKIICSRGALVVTEWALSGTKREQYFGLLRQLPFHARGVSIVQVDDGKVSRWSEYYDQTLSRRYSLAASFVQID
jgi:steroid delta-isomerase-like uncharacterized protein